MLRVDQKSQGAPLVVSSMVHGFTGGEYSSVHPCDDFYELLSVLLHQLQIFRLSALKFKQTVAMTIAQKK